MQFSSRSMGVAISALGAVLVLCGTFLPTYGSGDYERAGLQRTPVFIFVLLVVPAVLVLVSSVIAWFRSLPGWLVVLCLVILFIAFILHLFGSVVNSAVACFDVCPPGGVHLGTGFWLPLVGFLLSAYPNHPAERKAIKPQAKCRNPR